MTPPFTLYFWCNFAWGWRNLRPRTFSRAWAFAWQCQSDLREYKATVGDLWQCMVG